jgi:antitoxin (DNA-binding transcriptional repressor) of toxin-antitoxin stability system
MIHMKTVTVRDLRTKFPAMEALLLEGEELAVTKRNQIVAILVSPTAWTVSRKPDFKRRFGRKTLVGTNGRRVIDLLLAERAE